MELELLKQILDKLDGLEQRIIKIENDVAELKSEIINLKSEIVEQKSEIVGVKSEMAEIKSEVTELKFETANIKNRMIIMENDNKQKIGGLYDSHVLIYDILGEIRAGIERIQTKNEKHDLQILRINSELHLA